MYAPGPVPSDPRLLAAYLAQELERLKNELQPQKTLQLAISYAEPERPRDGMVIYADGTELDPDASGDPGFYGYVDGAWVRLG